jgi:hypothetical protein
VELLLSETPLYGTGSPARKGGSERQYH